MNNIIKKCTIASKVWKDVKNSVERLNPRLFEIIEEINPRKLPILDVTYPYGMTISNDQDFYLPDSQGNITTLKSKNFPYTFVVENTLETFISTPHIIPWQIYSPGDFFPFNSPVETSMHLKPRPRAIFSLTSGKRNISVLPLMSPTRSYKQLARKYSIDPSIEPEKAVDHFHIIKSVIAAHDINWRSRVFMFGEEWKEKIQNDNKWQPLKIFLMEQALQKYAFKKNTFYLDYAFSEITRDCDIHNSNLTQEMIKKTLLIALGDYPGYKPSINDEGFPLTAFLEIFPEAMNLKNSTIVVESSMHCPTKDKLPVYNSIWISSSVLSDINKTFRPLASIKEMSDTLNLYLKGFESHLLTRDSAYGQLNKYLECKFYTERGSSSGLIKDSSQLVKNDIRFSNLNNAFSEVENGFPKRSLFSKALVSVKLKPGIGGK